MSDAKTTRDQIVEAADELFYRQGYEYTSFADIASAVRISRGNFYYHFKTKDDILAAVIESRLSATGKLLQQWQETGQSAEDRIRSFIEILLTNREKIKLYGCPVGTLCGELGKIGHSAQADAKRLFTLFRIWLRGQFRQLGRRRDADQLALHLLARSQGVATLASAFRDDGFIRREVKLLHAWVDDCARNAARSKPAGSTNS